MTVRALWEMQNVMDCIPDELWDTCYGGAPLWQHVYHTLHHLDQWFINPRDNDFQSFLLRVFQLVAYGNSLACPDEFRQVSIECMMGEARHLDAARSSAIVSAGKGNAQDA